MDLAQQQQQQQRLQRQGTDTTSTSGSGSSGKHLGGRATAAAAGGVGVGEAEEEEVFFDAEEDDWLDVSDTRLNVHGGARLDGGAGSQADHLPLALHYPLHRAVFEADVVAVKHLLDTLPQEESFIQDVHGNQVIHLAASRSNLKIAEILLSSGFSAFSKNSHGWTPFDEAVQSKNVQMCTLIRKHMIIQAKNDIRAKKAHLLETLQDLPDFCIKLNWELSSSLPGIGTLIRMYTPHDTYTIWKRGKAIRVDGTLMGVDSKSTRVIPEWKRGPFSLVYDASEKPSKIMFINRKRKTFINLKEDKKSLEEAEENEAEGDMASILEMPNDQVKFKTVDFKFHPVKGWFGGELTERVEGWDTTVYEATGKIKAISKLKSSFSLPSDATFDEYLTTLFPEDEADETMLDLFSAPAFFHGEQHHSDEQAEGIHSTGGAASEQLDVGPQLDDGDSVERPDKHHPMSSKAETSALTSGPGSVKPSGRKLKAKCWMAKDFPMSLRQLLPLLDVVGMANKHIQKVSKFMEKYGDMRRFPVKVQIPIIMTIYALVGFKEFEYLQKDGLEEGFFDVSKDFTKKKLSANAGLPSNGSQYGIRKSWQGEEYY